MYSLEQRLAQASHPVTRRLLKIMLAKKTNLSASADLTRAADLLAFADAVGPHICLLKTHIDIVTDFSDALIVELQRLAEQHQFLLFEDRKFADIGNTVVKQYSQGCYRIADWATITNAHPLPGPGIVSGLKQVGVDKGNALLLLAQMSAAGNLIDAAYTQQAVAMAQAHPDFVIGFIARERLSTDPTLLHFTPGIALDQQGDPLGQQYLTPAAAIARGSDVLIVGRGLYGAPDPAAAAAKYQLAAWQAYEESLAKQ